MASTEKVTVDRSYFEALLRRADFHTTTQLLDRPDPANVTISKVEYDSLLRTAREYEFLRSALFQGGITEETLDLLISNANKGEQRKDSGISVSFWGQDAKETQPTTARSLTQLHPTTPYQRMPWRTGGPPASFNLAPGTAPYSNGHLHPAPAHSRGLDFQRNTSYGLSSMLDDNAFDDEDFAEDANQLDHDFTALPSTGERRTLYFSGFSDRTTYRDLLSVIKGGKLLSVSLRSERSATVTFLNGAAEFLAWAKRNDIYLHAKRIEVKWAERQYHLNGHITNKIANGATRNIIVHSATEKGLTEAQIRADMDHIHNLVIVEVTFRNGDAYVSMNSIHNALFARTCMMSRSTYKGCKIEFYRDECDVPLPARTFVPKTIVPEPAKKKGTVTNRFDLLNINGSDGSSNEENRTPPDDDSDVDTIDVTRNMGVNLRFLDSDST